MKIFKKNRNSISPNLWSGGKTFELFIYPQDSNYAQRNFDFRLSSATIDEIPSAFTRFDGYVRYLIMGYDDLRILRNDLPETYPKGTVFQFNSHDKVISFSKGIDFNLMIRSHFMPVVVNIGKASLRIREKFIFVYSLKAAFIRLNGKVMDLLPEDCLLLINSNRETVYLESEKNLIYGYWSY